MAVKVEVEEYRPFPNGTSFDVWQERNCDRCKKYVLIDPIIGKSSCPIAEAIAWHACGEPLTKKMAIRMGYLDKNGVVVGNDCTERVIGKARQLSRCEFCGDYGPSRELIEGKCKGCRKIDREIDKEEKALYSLPKPEPKLPMDQQMRQAGMATLPGF